MAKQIDMFSVALLLLLAMVAPSPCCCFTCHQEERSALSLFKRGLDDPSDQLESWRGLDCCSWKGITCHILNGHVVRLDLSNGFIENGLSVRNSKSQIFHGLLQLQHLEYLHLGGIDFYPLRIPSELAMLHRLTHLSLAGCWFTGPIPSFIGNMSSLKYLDIPGLEMGQLGEWIGNLRGLEYLALAGVNLTRGGDRVVENIAASLTNLTTLDMTECRITILSPLANLTSLSHLYLDDNDFSYQPFPNWISNLTALVSLSLWDCGLQGPIPFGLLSLPHLRNLYLRENPDLTVNLSFIVQHSRNIEMLLLGRTSVGGVIPNSIGNMSSLTSLDLFDTNIEGVLPPSVGNLSRLEVLSLSSNSLRGSIPWTILGGLSKLVVLDLGSNQLNGSLLSVLGNLSSLIALDLSNNSFSGTIPPSIQQLSSLRVLRLDNNKFHGTFLLSLLANFTEMSELFLSRNNLLTIKVNGFWIPKFQLQRLGLRSCNMGDFPLFISTQYAIEYLDLSNNNLSGYIPHWLWDVSHYMEFLDLSMNQFYGFIPKKIGQNLRFLSLAKNNLCGGIPHSIYEGQLEVLDLSNNKLSGKIFTNFGNFSTTLKVLNLENNLFEGEITSMACLQTLKLGGNRLQGPIPLSLKNCSSLEILDLGYNSMQGEIANWIQNLTSLRILVLRSNKFEGGIPLQLAKLQNLQVLILSNNSFSGNIPSNLGKLKAMTYQTQSTEVLQYNSNSSSSISYVEKLVITTKGQKLEYERSLALIRCLDISNNNFSGDIPHDIGFLIVLKVLNLSGNQLSSEIPNSFEKLVQLESLDLSRNNLIGVIPIELQLLTFLSYLDVSHNNLSGRIPQGGQLLTFPASSFSNNKDLCGLQININCSSSFVSPKSSDDEDVNEEEWEQHIWWEVGLGLSFGFGFAIVIGVLCFSKKWRSKCFKIMDDIIVIVDEIVRENIFH